MVQAVFDPVRVPVLNLTGEELQEIRDAIAAGVLPPDFLTRHQEAVSKNVFGFDAKTDKHGNYIEQGHGAKGHETANHFNALKKAEAMGVELPGTYDRAIAEIYRRDPALAKKIGLPVPLPAAER